MGLINVGSGRTAEVEWLVQHLKDGERQELFSALAPYVEAETAGPVSLEKFKKDFSDLSSEDRKEFMKTMQEAINYAYSAMTESEFDFALQADLDRRNKEAYGAGWEKSVAEAKARGEQARREALGDIDAAIKAETDKLKQGAAR